MDSSESAVTDTAVTDVAGVIAKVFCIDDESWLKLGEVEWCAWGFGADSVVVSRFRDDFAYIFVNKLVSVKVRVSSKACPFVGVREGGGGCGVVGLEKVVRAVRTLAGALHQHGLVVFTVKWSFCGVRAVFWGVWEGGWLIDIDVAGDVGCGW